jgi:taurine dioxygenase
VTFTTEALSDPIGVEVRGLDLSAPLRDDDRKRLRELFATRHLLLFRGQEISADVQVALCQALGPVVDPVAWVSNVQPGFHPEGELLFHSDYVFTPTPMLGLSLYAVELAPGVAPTRFANAVRALETLDPGLAALVAEVEVVQVIDAVNGRDNVRTRLADVGGEDAPLDEYPRHTTPGVVRHPTTGRPYLSVYEQQSSHVVGWTGDAGEALLQQLFAHLQRPEHVYDHHWREHDLVVWDNLAVQHGRRANPNAVRRSLRRVAIHNVPTSTLIAGTGFDPEWRHRRAAASPSG